MLKLASDLRSKHHLVIDPGYGKIRGKTFRLSNMGDETEETVSHLLACLDDAFGSTRASRVGFGAFAEMHFVNRESPSLRTLRHGRRELMRKFPNARLPTRAGNT